MVSSENGDSILKADLECDKESDGLNTVVATIDIVTHEEVVGVGGLSSNLKQFTQVMELSVNVTANSHWCAYLLHV